MASSEADLSNSARILARALTRGRTTASASLLASARGRDGADAPFIGPLRHPHGKIHRAHGDDSFSARLLCAPSTRFALGARNRDCALRDERGFAIGPILYILALVGVGAGVLFSGYSQILRSNVQVTNDITAKSDLSAAANTISATSELSSDGTKLCPQGSSHSTCGISQLKLVQFADVAGADTSKIPTNAASVSAGSGSPLETGVYAAGAGLKQLDPWGHFYVYCRWENLRSSGSSPAFVLLSAGSDGTLQTGCGASVAAGDDQILIVNVANAIERSSVWQAGSTDVHYGAAGTQVKVNSDGSVQAISLTVSSTATISSLNLTTALPLSSGGTGATTAVGARANLGSGTTGDALFLANSAAGARSTLGSGTTGDALFLATTASGARATLYSGVIGDALFISNTASSARATLGSTAIGDALFVASTASAARVTLGAGAIGQSLFTDITASGARTDLGSGITGDLIFTATTASTARSVLGSGALGDSMFMATTASAGRALLQLTGTNIPPLDVSVNGNSGNVTGVVAITNGGTGASDAATALSNLGGNNASNLTTGTLAIARIADGSITGAKIGSQTITNTNLDIVNSYSGAYNWGTVDNRGRVTYAKDVSTSILNGGDASVAINGTGTGNTVVFSTLSTTQMTLSASGYLGLGTNAPGERLHVNTGNIRISGPAATSRELQFATGTASKRWTIRTDLGAETGTNAGSDFVINSYSDAGALTATPFTITRSTGNVGVGTSTPGYHLDSWITSGPYNTRWYNSNNGTGEYNANIVSGAMTSAVGYFGIGGPGTGNASFRDSFVVGTQSAHTLNLNTSDTARVTILSNGNVGVGATSPKARLQATATNYDNAPVLGQIKGPLYVTNYDANYGFMMGVHSGDGHVWMQAARTDGSATAYNITLQEAGGSVGIGTNVPTSDSQLDVYNSGVAQIDIHNSTTGGGAGKGIQIGIDGSMLAYFNNQSNGDISFNTNASGRMRIMAGGNIGIGTSSARTALDIGAKTDAIYLPTGDNSARPGSPAGGMFRYNSTTDQYEGYFTTSGTWSGLTGTGGGALNGGLTVLGSGTANTNPARSGDATTGLASLSATSVSIVTGGVERLRVNNSGQVGIGTYTINSAFTTAVSNTATNVAVITPAMALMNTSTASGAMNAIMFLNPGTYGSAVIGTTQTTSSNAGDNLVLLTKMTGSSFWNYNQMVLSSNGNIGIGTATPANALSIYGSAATGSSIRSQITNANSTGVADSYAFNDSNKYAGFQIWGSSATGIYAGMAVANLAKITSGGDNMYVGTDSSAPLILGTAATERLRISSAGTVGIGTTNPLRPLQIGSYAGLATDGTDTNLTTNLYVSSGWKLINANAAAIVNLTAADGAIRFHTAPAGSAGGAASLTERLTLLQGGSVGIGSTTPRVSLDLSQKNDAIFIPRGNVAERPSSPVGGMFRYNSATDQYEGYFSSTSTWSGLTGTGGGPLSGASVTLGTSTSITNPSRNADATTGLASLSVGAVSIVGAGTEILRATSTSVGIGSTTPATGLDISKAIRVTSDQANNYNEGIRINDASNSYAGVFLGGTGISGATTSMWSLLKTSASNLEVRNNSTTVATFTPAGNVGIGTTAPVSGFHLYNATATAVALIQGSATSGSTLEFARGGSYQWFTGVDAGSKYYIANGTIGSQAVTIDAATANVGMGTTSPATPLHIYTALTGTPDVLRIESTYAAGGNGPSIQFRESGVWTPARIVARESTGYAGILAFETRTATGGGGDNTTERMRIDAVGNVGIGTTSPGVALDVVQNKAMRVGTAYISSGGSNLAHFSNHAWYNGSSWVGDGTAGALYQQNGQLHNFYSHTATASPAFTLSLMIDANGNVGIGTTTPQGKFSLGNPVSDTTLKTYTNVDNGIINYYQAQNFPTSNAYYRALDIVSAGGNTNSVIRFFSQSSNNANPSENMRIDSNGYVGIGTTNPFYGQLHVNKSNAAGLGGDLWITNSGTNTVGSYARLSFGPDGTTDSTPNAAIENIVTNTSLFKSDMAFKFWDGAGYNEKIRFQGDTGYVGIGTTNPTVGLHVQKDNGNGWASLFQISSTSNGILIGANSQVSPVIGSVQGVNSGGNAANMALQPAGGSVGIGTTNVRVALDIGNKSDAIALPSGNTGARPGSPAGGMFRYNSATDQYEGYFTTTSTWSGLTGTGGGALGGGAITLGSATGSTNPSRSSDLTTGLASLNAATVGVVASGIEMLRVTSTSVGVGTSSPIALLHAYGANKRIMIQNSATGNNVGYQMAVNDATIGQENGGMYLVPASTANQRYIGFAADDNAYQMIIRADGNVGIGNTSPQSVLDVSTTATPNTVVAQVRSAAAASGESWSYLALRKDSGSPTVYYGGAVGGYLSQGVGGGLGFFTYSGSATPAERMRIDQAGNVGIGTSSPGYKLDVYGGSLKVTSNANNVLQLDTTATNQQTSLMMSNTGNGKFQIGVQPTGSFFLYDTVNAKDRLNVTTAGDVILQPSSGSVGIGTTSPGALLDVWSSGTQSTTFTGSTLGSARIVGGTYAVGGLTKLDFTSNGSGATTLARIAAYNDGGGSRLMFGTSNSYGSGITNTAMTINASGYVGIGTTGPTVPFVINNAADGTTFMQTWVGGNARHLFSTDGSANALIRTGNSVDLRLGVNEDAIVIKNGGNVGIGTTSPGYPLSVDKIGWGTVVNTTSGFTSNLMVGPNYNSGTPYNAGNQVLGVQSWTGEPAISLEYHNVYGWVQAVTGGGALQFRRGYAGQNGTTMTLDTSGNVGIGTAAMAATVHILGAQSSTPVNGTVGALRLDYAGGNNLGDYGAGISFTQRWYASSTTQIAVGQITGVKTNGDGNFGGGLAFWYAPNAANNMAEGMRLNSAGQLGIGTTSPGTTLQIVTATANSGFQNTDGTRWIRQMPGTVGNGSYNGVVLANDNAIIFSGGTAGSGYLTIAPWSSTIGGLRMDGSGNVSIGTSTISSKLTVAGMIESTASGIKFPDGTIQTTAGGGGTSALGSSTATTNPYRSGDLTTGLVSINAGTVGMVASGTEMLRVTATSVGIGTTNPAVAFDVNGGVRANGTYGYQFSTNASVYVQENYGPVIGLGGNTATFGANFKNSSNTSIMYVRADGNVGIGTTSPTEKMEISGGSVRIDGQAANFSAGAAGLNMDYSSAASAARIYTVAGASGSAYDMWLGVNSGVVMTLKNGGNVGIGTTGPGTKLEVYNSTAFNPISNATSAVTLSGNYGGGLLFKDTAYAGIWASGNGQVLNFATTGTAGGFGTAGGAMVLSNGSVGIGSTGPNYKLDVVDSSTSNEVVMNGKSSASSGYGFLGVLNGSNQVFYGVNPSGGAFIKANPNVSSGNIAFQVLHNLGSNALITALGSGNVGIGTTSPRTTLDTGAGTLSGAANDYTKGQFTMSGGGTVTWAGSGGKLKWTSRFIVIPMGTSSSNGYVDINQPTSNISSGQVFSGVARTADSNGVILNSWEALYAVHTPGGNNSAVAYYIVRYDNAFNAPSNWILVAAVNGDDGSIKLGNGQTIASGGSWNGATGGSGSYVNLQASTPGTAQTGNLNISGLGIFGYGLAAGSGSASGVSLQMASNSAIRDVTNGGATMYFDVSSGGASNGAFHWRSSNSYTTQMYLNPSGYLVVGPTTTANSRLDVHQALTASGLYEGPALTLSTDNGSNNWVAGQITGYVAAGTSNSTSGFPGGMLFKTRNGDGTPGNPATTKMVLDANGSLGVGTTAPAYTLHVNGPTWLNNASGDTGARAVAATVSGSIGSNYTNGADPGDSLRLMSIIAKGGATRPAILSLRNPDASGFWDIVMDANDSTKLKFASTSGANPLTLTQNGLVGMGTTTPGTLLQLVGGNDSDQLRISNWSGGYFSLGRNGTTGAFWIQGTQVGANNIALVPTSGSVGIGTGAPAQKLEVNGTAQIDGNLYLTNSNSYLQQGGGYNVYNSSNSLLSTNYTIKSPVNNSGIYVENQTPYNLDYVSGDVSMPYGYAINDSRTGEHAGFLLKPTASNGAYGSMVFYLGNDMNSTQQFQFVPFTWDGSNNHLGSPLMVINANGGNVGIGTATPNYKVDVWSLGSPDIMSFRGSTAGTQFVISTGWNGAADYMGFRASGRSTSDLNLDSNGSVAIGTTVANNKLEVNTTSGAENAAQFNSTGNVHVNYAGGANSYQFHRYYTNGTSMWEIGNAAPNSNMFYFNPTSGAGVSGAAMAITRSNTVGINTTSITHTLEVNGTLNVTGAITCGSGCTGGPWSVSGSYIIPSSNSYKVGIGTATPSYPLHIASSADANALLIQNGSSAGYPLITCTNNAFAATLCQFTSGIYNNGGTLYNQNNLVQRSAILDDGKAYLEIQGGTSGYTFINGTLGVGTASPGYTAHVYKAADPSIGLSGGSGSARIYSPNLQLHINPDSTTMTQINYNNSGAVAICGSGGCNVGIGTTNPMVNLHLGAGKFIGVPTGYANIPSGWKRGTSGIILAGAQNADGSGWAYGSRIAVVDPGGGLYTSFDVLNNGTWYSNSLVLGGTTCLGCVGVGTNVPAGRLDVNNYGSGGNGDGIVLYQPTDNLHAIQTYIDGHWSDRTTYGGPCCNELRIQTEAGFLRMGNALSGGTVEIDGNLGVRTGPNSYALHVGGDIHADGGWLRTSGNAGWYSETYGGGWVMTDSTWIRSYNSKPVFMNNGFDTDNGAGQSGVGCGGGKGGGQMFQVCGNMLVNFIYDRDNTGYYLDMNGTSRLNYAVVDRMDPQIMYDMNDNSYYIDMNNTSRFNAITMRGSISVSQGNDTWGGIILADDGDIVDPNNGYAAMRFSSGVQIYTGNRSGSAGITLHANTNVYAGGFYINSDRRLKHDITPFDRKGLAVVEGLRTVHFKWNKDNAQDYGVIAQEVQKVLPEAVVEHPDNNHMLTVQYDKLVLPVIEAVKELYAMVKDIIARLDGHDKALAELKSANDNLKHDNDNLRHDLDDMKAEMRAMKEQMKQLTPAETRKVTQ